MFKELIKSQYPTSNAESHTESPLHPLTSEEENALWYVAGYIIRKLQEQLESTSLPKRDVMILLLMECAGGELDEDCGTELWTNMIDRGGISAELRPELCRYRSNIQHI